LVKDWNVLTFIIFFHRVSCCSHWENANGEVSKPKKQHLIMIFMRYLLTTIIGQCWVRA